MIIRAEKDKSYSVICNVILRDNRLSLRARGLAAYLLTQPDDWSISSDALARQFTEGRDAVRNAMKELETHGYIQRVKNRDKKGQWFTELVLFEKGPQTHDGLSGVGEPGVGALGVLLSTNTKYYNNTIADAIQSQAKTPTNKDILTSTNTQDPEAGTLTNSASMNGKVKPLPPPVAQTPPSPKRKPTSDPAAQAAWEMYLAKIEQYEPGAVLAFSRERGGINAIVKAGWTAEQIGQCFDIMKAQPFYQGKHLSAQEIGKDIGAKLNGKGKPHNGAERIDRDLFFSNFQTGDPYA